MAKMQIQGSPATFGSEVVGQSFCMGPYDAQRNRYQQAFMYRTSPKLCNACPVKSACITSRYGRVVRRSLFQDYLDRWRGLNMVNIQGLFTAAGQNIKRLLKNTITPILASCRY